MKIAAQSYPLIRMVLSEHCGKTATSEKYVPGHRRKSN